MLTKDYLLHTNPSKFKELEKALPSNMFLLSTLNYGAFLNILIGIPNHNSQSILNETHELGS